MVNRRYQASGYTDADRRRWRKLVLEARRCANTPERPAGGFTLAADKAYKAVFPDQLPDLLDRRPFLDLISAGRGWAMLTLRDRKGQRERVRELARRCAILMGDEPADETPPRPPVSAGEREMRGLRYRADLDG